MMCNESCLMQSICIAILRINGSGAKSRFFPSSTEDTELKLSRSF